MPGAQTIDVAEASATPSNWTADMRREYDKLEPRGVYLASTARPVSGQEHDLSGAVVAEWGGPNGSRLVAIGPTTAQPWQRVIDNGFARGVERLRLQWRLWVPPGLGPARDKAQRELFDLLTSSCSARRAGPERNGLLLLQPTVDLAALRDEVMQMAALVSNQVWTDAMLRAECKAMVARRAKKAASRDRAGIWNAWAPPKT